MEDQRLVQRLAQNGMPLGVCPTTNIRTGILSCHEMHPVRALFDAGVPMFFVTPRADDYAPLHNLGPVSAARANLLHSYS